MTQDQIERREQLFAKTDRLKRHILITGSHASLEETLADIIVRHTKFFPETGEVRIASCEELAAAFAQSSLVQQMAAVLVHRFEEDWIAVEAKRSAEEANAILNHQYQVIYEEIARQERERRSDALVEHCKNLFG